MPKKNKKAQNAIEFLLSYGWMVMVVLIVIGALAYFGVLDPQLFLPERCYMASPLGCSDLQIGRDGLAVVLSNNAGEGITISELSFSSDALARSRMCVVGALDVKFGKNSKAAFYANDPIGCKVVKNGKQRYEVKVTYKRAGSDIEHTALGSVFGRRTDALVQGDFGGNNVVLYWKFDSPVGSVHDYSQKGNDGLVSGAFWQDTDCPSTDGCYRLGDTPSTYIMANPVNNFPKKEITVAFFIKTAEEDANDAILTYAAEAGENNNDFALYWSASLGIRVAGVQDLGVGTYYAGNTWKFGAATWKNSDGIFRAYVSPGLPYLTIRPPIAQGETLTQGGALVLGQWQSVVGGGFMPGFDHQGILDELLIYDRALDDEDIAYLRDNLHLI